MISDLVFFCVLAALAGLLFGSFLNVCIYRIPRDQSVVLPRSFCPACEHPIAWYDNIPVLSYLLLRGRCRHCKDSISIRYLLVEITTAVLFTLTAWEYGWSAETLKWCLFEAMLVVLFWTDFETRILPDELTLGGSLLGLIFATLIPVPSGGADTVIPGASPIFRSLFNAAVAGIILTGSLWLIGAVWAPFRRLVQGVLRLRQGEPFALGDRVEVLGLGDVKLLLLIGIFLGLEQGLEAVLLGALLGSVIGVIYILAARQRWSEYQLPAGTFFCAAATVIPLVRIFGLPGHLLGVP